MSTKLHAIANANERPLQFFMTAGEVTQHGIAGDQTQFCNARRRLRLSRDHGAVACGSSGAAPKAKQAGD
jgi:hypothetical protein